MTKEQFKKQAHLMTNAQKALWYKINTEFVHEVNTKEFKTKSAYKNAMAKVYDKTVKEYLKKVK